MQLTTNHTVFTLLPQPMAAIATLADVFEALSAPIDSFLEEHILSAQFSVIADRTTAQPVGHIAIYDDSLLTQFYLKPAYRRHGQPLYHEVLQHHTLTEALVPTCDEFFLSHALDNYTKLHKQAYFFVAGAPVQPWDDRIGLSFRQATMADYEAITALNDDFIDKLQKRIEMGEIHVGEMGWQMVALGIIERGQLLPDYASIGMFVKPEMRRQGIGTRTIGYLRGVCEAAGLQPLAGCGYDNLLSKRTLEAAGMVTGTRLLCVIYEKPVPAQ